jgi:DNA-binding protein HU-beta
MNKQELISSVSETTGLSRNDAVKAVEGVFDAIGSALKRGDEVRLVGFGTFSCSKRKASTGRNPRTGEPMSDQGIDPAQVQGRQGPEGLGQRLSGASNSHCRSE